MEEKRKPCAISTDVQKLWKAVFVPTLVQSSGFLFAPDLRLPLLDPGAAFQDFPARHQPLCDRAGLSPIGLRGASEKCAKTLRAVHTSFTIFPQALFLCTGLRATHFLRDFSGNSRRKKILAQAEDQQA